MIQSACLSCSKWIQFFLKNSFSHQVYKNDGLPPVICNNCIYRLGAAYHFKQQCENSDLRLRSYLGILDKGYGETRDSETNTEPDPYFKNAIDGTADKLTKSSKRYRNRYKKKLPEERKKRGPKPQIKVPQTCYECHKTFKSAAQLTIHIRYFIVHLYLTIFNYLRFSFL